MPVGGVADQILVQEGDRVKAGQVLMKLDTEASEEQRNSLEKAIKLKQEQLTLKQEEKRNTCLLYTSPSPRDGLLSRMPSSA